jgi:hypothetical protein
MRTTTMAAMTVAAALAAGATFLGTSAEAAPAANPFAGEYTGPMPDSYIADPWGSISISSDGKIVGTKPPAGYSDDKFVGSVKSDGTYEIIGTWNLNKARWWVTDVRPVLGEEPDAAAKPLAGVVKYVQSSGTLTKDAYGNLYGTTSRGNTFVWMQK